MALTLQTLLLCVQMLLPSGEVSGLRRQDEQEGLVSVPAHAVAVQRVSVLRQALPDHPALQRRVEPVVSVDLLAEGNETMSFCIIATFSCNFQGVIFRLWNVILNIWFPVSFLCEI